LQHHVREWLGQAKRIVFEIGNLNLDCAGGLLRLRRVARAVGASSAMAANVRDADEDFAEVEAVAAGVARIRCSFMGSCLACQGAASFLLQ